MAKKEHDERKRQEADAEAEAKANADETPEGLTETPDEDETPTGAAAEPEQTTPGASKLVGLTGELAIQKASKK